MNFIKCIASRFQSCDLSFFLTKLLNKLLLISLCLAMCFNLSAQDSLMHKIDTAWHRSDSYTFSSVDSIQKDFHHRSDSLQKAFASPLNKLHSEIGSLNYKKDSLSRLHLPTQSLPQKIDSLPTD